jgi:hypothetical protein
MGNRTSVYLDDDLQAAVKASGTPLAELIRRGLGANTANAESDTAVTDLPASLAAIGPGEPSPGAVCMTPGCWQKDTRACGLRKLPLCTACAAAIQGREHKRELPPSAARLTRRGAA